jgi:hypothetical protein
MGKRKRLSPVRKVGAINKVYDKMPGKKLNKNIVNINHIFVSGTPRKDRLNRLNRKTWLKKMKNRKQNKIALASRRINR